MLDRYTTGPRCLPETRRMGVGGASSVVTAFEGVNRARRLLRNPLLVVVLRQASRQPWPAIAHPAPRGRVPHAREQLHHRPLEDHQLLRLLHRLPPLLPLQLPPRTLDERVRRAVRERARAPAPVR